MGRRGMLVAAAIAAAALAGCGGAGTPGSGGSSGGEAGWPAPNADLRNTRHVGGPIDAASVGQLRVAWRVPAIGMAATPVVVGGVVYIQDLNSNVTAIELRGGRMLWSQQYEETSIGPNGVAVGDGRVYGASETAIFALDAKTGRRLWERHVLENAHDGIDMAPGYADHTVYVSTVPVNLRARYAGGGRGVLWALDGATGRTRWKWDTVPRSLWGRPDLNAGGGLWHPPAFDGEGGLYAAIGNPGPWGGTPRYPWGASRPGPNRWTNAIVKLDAASGRFRWGRQVVPHDLFDWDLECPPILMRANGRLVALAAGKMGFVYAFDAHSGALLWKRAVGRHNGHDGDGLLAMRGRLDPRRALTVLPGQLGGVETQMAADQRTVYVPVVDLPSTYYPDREGVSASFAQARGEVVALDVASGRVKWTRPLPQALFSATTVVNDLVFTATFDGRLWALRKDSGRVAWSATLPAGTNTPLAVAGDTLLAAASVPQREGQSLALIAYRLQR